jgi:transcriptional regulator with XRE-family HTH domain
MGAFADRLIERRDAAKLKPSQLAKQIGVKPSTIESLEAGKGWPTLGVLTRLADVLEVSAEDLIRLAEEDLWGERPREFNLYASEDNVLGEESNEVEKLTRTQFVALREALRQARREAARRKANPRSSVRGYLQEG